MRSLRTDRKTEAAPRSPRARLSGRTARAASGRRGPPKDDAISRGVRRVRIWFAGPMFLLALGLIFFALVAALFASGTIGRTINRVNDDFAALVSDAGFGISEIHIAGNNRTQPETILAALGFAPGQSIFAADLGGARARLMALDWVASADVQRRYPDAIFVRVTEKRPFALWQMPNSDQIALVERSGGIITTRDVEHFARLPKLIGPGAPDQAAGIVDAVAAHRAVSARVKAFEFQSDRRWNLILDDGVVVKLPETGWQKQVDALEQLIVDDGILERNVTEIDLRSPNQYFFVLGDGVKKAAKPGDKI